MDGKYFRGSHQHTLFQFYFLTAKCLEKKSVTHDDSANHYLNQSVTHRPKSTHEALRMTQSQFLYPLKLVHA